MFWTVLFIITPITLLNQFEHDIKIIRPYVDEKTIYELESHWALMSNYDAYIEIHEIIEAIKVENGIID